jgi:hypothetical protein
VFSDADDAALYDLLNPWDPKSSPGDRFYHELVMAADSVLSPQAVSTFLDAAGFQVEAQYGDWHRAHAGATSREITTIARK